MRLLPGAVAAVSAAAAVVGMSLWFLILFCIHFIHTGASLSLCDVSSLHTLTCQAPFFFTFPSRLRSCDGLRSPSLPLSLSRSLFSRLVSSHLSSTFFLAFPTREAFSTLTFRVYLCLAFPSRAPFPTPTSRAPFFAFLSR